MRAIGTVPIADRVAADAGGCGGGKEGLQLI